MLTNIKFWKVLSIHNLKKTSKYMRLYLLNKSTGEFDLFRCLQSSKQKTDLESVVFCASVPRF